MEWHAGHLGISFKKILKLCTNVKRHWPPNINQQDAIPAWACQRRDGDPLGGLENFSR